MNDYMLGALSFLFHLQSDRDCRILGKEKYDILRNDVIHKLPQYFNMYDYSEHKHSYDITVGLSIEFTIDGVTYTLDYGKGTATSPPIISNQNLDYKWLPKAKDMECDTVTLFNVTVQLTAKAKPITISFMVSDEEDDDTNPDEEN